MQHFIFLKKINFDFSDKRNVSVNSKYFPTSLIHLLLFVLSFFLYLFIYLFIYLFLTFFFFFLSHFILISFLFFRVILSFGRSLVTIKRLSISFFLECHATWERGTFFHFSLSLLSLSLSHTHTHTRTHAHWHTHRLYVVRKNPLESKSHP